MPSTANTTNAAGGDAAETSSPSWRRPGQAYRTALLTTDADSGGSSFVQLNASVPISKYYQVSRRAYHQFRDGCAYVNDHNGESATYYLEVHARASSLVSYLLP